MPDRLPVPSRQDPLLQWLTFTGVSVFAFVVLWYYGLLRDMVVGDRTRISSVIGVLYAACSLHCLVRILTVSREGVAAARTARAIADDGGLLAQGAADRLPAGLVAGHVAGLVAKSQAQGALRLDQTLLLRVLAARLRGSNGFGAFASDALMKLGLLGTIVGFILMLSPIGGLDMENREAVHSSMALMSGGMAVAMYTTLAGLVGSILLRIQYLFLDGATAALFAFAVDLTEVHVVSALEHRLRAP